MFKLAVLIASLAYASAGYAEAEQSVSYAVPEAAHYSSAPAVSYSTMTRNYSPSLAYAAPAHHGYAHAAPILASPSHAYNTRTYAAPALSYGHSYAPSLAYDNYGYSAYAAPLTTKTKNIAIAQPQLYHQNTYATQAVVATPVLATHGYNYAPAGAPLLGYNNNHHGHYAY